MVNPNPHRHAENKPNQNHVRRAVRVTPHIRSPLGRPTADDNLSRKGYR